MNTLPFRTLSSWFREQTGQPIRKVPLDNGATCPNRDGSIGRGGCLFCSVPSFSPIAGGGRGILGREKAEPLSPEDLTCAFERLALSMTRGKARLFLPYLNGYTPTNLPLEILAPQLRALTQHPLSAGAALCTRPDMVSDELIDFLSSLVKSGYLIMVELGLQSCDDALLRRMGRGHSVRDFTDTASRLGNIGVHTCAHLIFGLPGQSMENMIESTMVAAGPQGCHGVKFHNFHICRGTIMDEMMKQEPWPLMTLEEYARTVAKAVSLVSPNTVVHRLCASIGREHLSAPQWAADAPAIRNRIMELLQEMHIQNTTSHT